MTDGSLVSMSDFDLLLDALDAAGLWTGLSAEQRDAAIDGSKASSDASWSRGGLWTTDGEDLADGSIEEWIQSMAPALSDVGLDVEVNALMSPFDPDSTGYAVTINGETLRLYDFDPDEPNLPSSDDPWLDCTVMPTGLLNRLLSAAGTDRRLALFWPGGNDGCAVLGPASVFERLSRTPWAQEMVVPT
jgi:hypothetical protein